MRRGLSAALMQAECDMFNANYKIGDEIMVCTGLFGESPKRAVVKYPAEIMGGHTPVVYVTGEANGAIALTHVGKIA